MKTLGSWSLSLAILGLQTVLLAVPSIAQSSKAAEIEVAGPWDYAVDEANYPGKIIVIAPWHNPPTNEYHHFAIFTGEKADLNTRTLLANEPYPGIYTLDFPIVSSDCPSHQNSDLKLLSIPGVDVPAVLRKTNQRIAFILPKPCYFSVVHSARAAVATRPIAAPKPLEQAYPTWLELHYQVSRPIATMSGASDEMGEAKTSYASAGIAFGTNARPSQRNAISLQLYSPFQPDTNDHSPCDNHSAGAFDSALELYGLKGKYYRQFPLTVPMDVDPSGQSPDYDLNCQRPDFVDGQHKLSELNLSIRKQIEAFPTIVEKVGTEEANRRLAEIETNVNILWGNNVPQGALDALKNAQNAIDRIAQGDRDNPAPKFRLAKVTPLFFIPGKTDCHKMQFNLNNAIP